MITLQPTEEQAVTTHAALVAANSLCRKHEGHFLAHGRCSVYRVCIVYTMGREIVELDALSAEDACNQALEWALGEGFLLLRCFIV